MEKQREIWIDVLKGIAIILVVIGHNCSMPFAHFIYTFHMPLFFLISGFLLTPVRAKKYLKKSFHRLIIPYICFLLLLSFPDFFLAIKENNLEGYKNLAKTLTHRIYGGQLLTGSFGVFWFITVLFFSTNIFNIIIQNPIIKKKKKFEICTFIFILLTGYLIPLLNFKLPWNIGAVPMAICYLYIGYQIRKWVSTNKLNFELFNKWKILFWIISIVLFLGIYQFSDHITLDFKYLKFGIPLVSFLISVLISLFVAFFAIQISKIPISNKIFSYCGAASLFIMYLHQPIKFYFFEKDYITINFLFIVILCILISVFIYYITTKFKITKQFILSQIKSVLKIRGI